VSSKLVNLRALLSPPPARSSQSKARTVATMRIAILLTTAAVSLSADWLERYHSGLKLLKLGQHAAARQEISSALRELEAVPTPSTQIAMVVHVLGQLEFVAGQYRTSLRHYERVLKLLPPSGTARAMVLADAAQSCIGLAEFGRALLFMRQALKLHPDRTEYWQLLATALYTTGNDTEAEAAAQRAAREAGLSNGDVYAASKGLLGAIYQRRKQYREAMTEMDAAVSSAKTGQLRSRITANRGTLWWRMGNPSKAVTDLRDALAEAEAAVGPEHPDLVGILDDYGWVLKRIGRKREAKDAINRASRIRAAHASEANLDRHIVNWRDLR
jgi:tetratricopeptide (TPR) repeat protein